MEIKIFSSSRLKVRSRWLEIDSYVNMKIIENTGRAPRWRVPFPTATVNSWLTRGGGCWGPHLSEEFSFSRFPWGTSWFSSQVSPRSLGERPHPPIKVRTSEDRSLLLILEVNFSFCCFRAIRRDVLPLTVSDPERKLAPSLFCPKQPFKFSLGFLFPILPAKSWAPNRNLTTISDTTPQSSRKSIS